MKNITRVLIPCICLFSLMILLSFNSKIEKQTVKDFSLLNIDGKQVSQLPSKPGFNTKLLCAFIKVKKHSVKEKIKTILSAKNSKGLPFFQRTRSSFWGG